MIVTKTRAETIGIRQEDQAAFSAFLLEEWNDQALKHEARREQIIRATRECNTGFREYDAAPRMDPKTKLPVDYRKITPEEVNEIWMRASERFLDDDPYIALMITHHAYTLHEHTQNRTGVWKDFFVTLAQRRGRIRDELGWRPSVTVEEGLAKTVRWYLDNEAWWRPLLSRSGVGERLGRA